MSPMRTQRGMGPLRRKGPKARWFFFLDGKRVTTPYSDKKAAEEWRRKHLAQVASKQIIGPENATISDLLQLVEDDYVRHGKKSIGALRSRMKHLRADLGKIRAVDLTERRIEAYRAHRERPKRVRNLYGDTRPGASPATINRELEVLRRALSLGKRQKLVVAPPFVEMAKLDNVRAQRITHRQYKQLIEALRPPEKFAAILAYHCGWRLGRILDLTWDRVDFAAMVIHPPAKQDDRKRVGSAPIYADMVDALLACQKQAEYTRSETVIHRASGGPVVDISDAWKAATKAVGLAGFRFHDLRACAASNLSDAGIPQHEIMRILGHQTDAMFRRYQIESPKRLRDIGERMEAFLEGDEREPKGRVN